MLNLHQEILSCKFCGAYPKVFTFVRNEVVDNEIVYTKPDAERLYTLECTNCINIVNTGIKPNLYAAINAWNSHSGAGLSPCKVCGEVPYLVRIGNHDNRLAIVCPNCDTIFYCNESRKVCDSIAIWNDIDSWKLHSDAKFDFTVNLTKKQSKQFLEHNPKVKRQQLKYKLEAYSPKDKSRGSYRIVALKDFDGVYKGQIGGMVESENNLSQEGHCWIYPKASVTGNAKLTDNAKISGNVTIKGNVHVAGESIMYACSNDDCIVEGPCDENKKIVITNSKLTGSIKIFAEDNLIISNSSISGRSEDTTPIFRAITDRRIQDAKIMTANDYCVIDKNDLAIWFYRTDKSGLSVSCDKFNGKLSAFKVWVDEAYPAYDTLARETYISAIAIAEDKLKCCSNT